MYEDMARIIIAERQRHGEQVNARAWQSNHTTHGTWRARLATVLNAVATRLAPAVAHMSTEPVAER